MSCCGQPPRRGAAPAPDPVDDNGPFWVVYPPRADGTQPPDQAFPTRWKANSAAASRGGKIYPDRKYKQLDR